MKILYHHRIASKDGQYVHVSEIVNSLRKLGVTLHMVSPALADTQEFGGELGFVASLKRRLPRARMTAEFQRPRKDSSAMWIILRTRRSM